MFLFLLIRNKKFIEKISRVLLFFLLKVGLRLKNVEINIIKDIFIIVLIVNVFGILGIN